MNRAGKTARRFFRRGEAGQALIVALVLLMLGSLIVVPGLKLASSDLKYHGVINENVREDYAADAGLFYAMTRLGNSTGPFGPESLPAAVNGRTVTVSVEEVSGGLYRITSVATGNGDNATLVGYAAVSSGVFEYCIATTDGDLTITDNGRATSTEAGQGNVYTNGTLTVTGNGIVNGNAKATGAINLSGNGRITGTQEEYIAPLDFAEIDSSVFLDEADQGTLIEGNFTIMNQQNYELGPVHITGSLSIEGYSTVILTGTVWVDGTVSMSANSRVEGGETIVAVGNIGLNGNAVLDVDDTPMIMSVNGNINVGGNSWMSLVVCAPNGHIDLGSNVRIRGAVYGRSALVDGNAIVEYETGLRQRGDLPGCGGPRLLSLDRGTLP